LKIPCYNDAIADDSAVAPTIPQPLLKLETLVKLDISFTNITTLSSRIGKMNLKELFLTGTKRFKSIPVEIGDIASIQTLDFSYYSSISSIPESIGRLKNPKELNLQEMKNLRSVPESLSYLTALQKLDFSSSSITSFPSLENLNNLQYLDLSANELQSFPSLGNIMIDLRTLKNACRRNYIATISWIL
jgi:Leucine-rich repeat (LRR) protein